MTGKFIPRNHLRGRIGSFKFEATLSSTGESIKFDANFQVSGVEEDSWHIFQERVESMHRSQEPRRKELKRLHKKFDRELRDDDNDDDIKQIQERIHLLEEELSGIDDIRKAIEKTIQRRTSLLDPSMIAYSDYRTLVALEEQINSWAQEGVKSQYGLEITIENLKRDRTLLETLQSEDRNRLLEDQRRVEETSRKIRNLPIEHEIKSKDDELKLLREKRYQLMERADYDDIDQEELDQINTEISQINTGISQLKDMILI